MRILFAGIVIILGANLMIDLLDSNMMNLIEERNQSIQQTIEKLWQTIHMWTT